MCTEDQTFLFKGRQIPSCCGFADEQFVNGCLCCFTSANGLEVCLAKKENNCVKIGLKKGNIMWYIDIWLDFYGVKKGEKILWRISSLMPGPVSAT